MKNYISPTVDLINIDATVLAGSEGWESVNKASSQSAPENFSSVGGFNDQVGTDYYDSGSYRTTLWGD